MQGPLTLKNKMLSTPLVGLSKASTPVRTRVISGLKNDIVNSTPINQLKFTSTLSKSPGFNKQNNQNFQNSQLPRSNSKVVFCNTNKLNENSRSKQNVIHKIVINSPNAQQDTNKLKKQKKQVTFSESIYQNKEALNFRQVNLSPIMALNRKLTQGPSLKNFRSFTPNAQIKRSDSPFNNNKLGKDSFQTKLPKPLPNQSIILRESSSLNNLFGSRMGLEQSQDKPISRLGSMAFSSLNKKINNKFNQSLTFEAKPAMKQSRSMNNVLSIGNIQYQSQYTNKALISSKQFKTSNHNQLKASNHLRSNSSIMNQARNNQISMCANNHDKKAKYKIMNSQQDEMVVYCSKCAIQLVQKGFCVQQLQDYNEPLTIKATSNTSNATSSSPYSRSFKQKFHSYKPCPSQTNQLKLEHIQLIKNSIHRQINIINQRNNFLQQKFNESIGEVDCYYNSIIAYIEQSKHQDKTRIQHLKRQNQRSHKGIHCLDRFQQYNRQLQHLLRTKNINLQASKQIQMIESELNQYLIQSAQTQNSITSNIKDNLISFQPTIQTQFDQFAQVFDKSLRLTYKLNKPTPSNKQSSKSLSHANKSQNQRFQQKPKDKSLNKLNLNSNALRFSFQKALQSQNRKKTYLESSMKALSEEEFDGDQQLQDQQQDAGKNQHQNPQNQYAQHEYGQHEYAQDQYAQNQYTQNQYAQNQYNQTQHNKNQGQYYEQNSFSHQSFSNYNNYEQQNIQKVISQGPNKISQPVLKQSKQRPFRTLFAEEDEILANFKAQQSTNQNNNIYSPTFKVI